MQDTLAALSEAVAAYKATTADAGQALRAAMVAAHKAGHSANSIADIARGAMSRPVVLETLGEASLRERAERALRDRGVDIDSLDINEIGVDLFTQRRQTMFTLDLPAREAAVSELLNFAYRVIAGLADAGLGVCQGQSTLNMADHLAEGEAVEIYDLKA